MAPLASVRHTEAMTDEPAAAPAPRTARARARAEITAEILASARRHLAEEGAAALSLRAIARDLGMASSAVYRYVPSRDDLLTRLIVEAYDGLGAAAEQAEAAVPRADLPGRFLAVGRAVRTWALAHPHEYALVYGSPVPGYRAPQDTVPPATRVPALLVGVLADAYAADRVRLPEAAVATTAAAALAPLRAALPPDLPLPLLAGGVLAWSSLFGLVSFELFGHLHNVVSEDPTERAAFFDDRLAALAALTGIA